MSSTYPEQLVGRRQLSSSPRFHVCENSPMPLPVKKLCWRLLMGHFMEGCELVLTIHPIIDIPLWTYCSRRNNCDHSIMSGLVVVVFIFVVLVGFKACVRYTMNKSADKQSPCGTHASVTISPSVSFPIVSFV